MFEICLIMCYNSICTPLREDNKCSKRTRLTMKRKELSWKKIRASLYLKCLSL